MTYRDLLTYAYNQAKLGVISVGNVAQHTRLSLEVVRDALDKVAAQCASAKAGFRAQAPSAEDPLYAILEHDDDKYTLDAMLGDAAKGGLALDGELAQHDA